MKPRAMFPAVFLVALLALPQLAGAVALHTFDCKNCHIPALSITALGNGNVCLDCHDSKEWDGKALPNRTATITSVFLGQDASNALGHNLLYNAAQLRETSHNWAASDNQLTSAGAAPPSRSTYPQFYSRYGSSNGRVTCSRCHNPHSTEENPQMLVLGAGKTETMCIACHAPWNKNNAVVNNTFITHPVDVTYNPAQAYYNTTSPPSNNGDINTANGISLYGGKVVCGTCHQVHFADSNPATADTPANWNTLSKGDGKILRSYGRVVGDAAKTSILCKTCHEYDTHGGSHSTLGCLDCHGGHSPSGNYNMLRPQVKSLTWVPKDEAAGDSDALPYTTLNAPWKAPGETGYCEGCHTIPLTVVQHNVGTAGMNECKGCHNHQTDSFTSACNACHGYAPSTNTAGGSTGYAVASPINYYNTAVFKDESKTPHKRHANGSGNYSFDCKQCHYTVTDVNTAPHQNGVFQNVYFSYNSASLVLAWTDGSAPSYSPAGASNSGTCSSVYCHSNGGPRSNGSMKFAATPPVWKDGSIAPNKITTCDACHGDDATSMNSSNLDNSSTHIKHLTKGYGCNVCHDSTATSDTAVDIPGGKHVNGTVEVSYNNGYSLGVGTLGPASYGNTEGTCGLYCHSDGAGNLATPDWDVDTTGACGTCHKLTVASGNPMISGSHTAHINDTDAEVGRNLGCIECHSNTVDAANAISNQANHVNGDVTIGMALDGNKVSCANITCHSDGNYDGALDYKDIGTAVVWGTTLLGGCDDCHGGGGVSYPIYANGGPGVNANSHAAHVSSGISCETCHAGTAAANALKSGALHVNGDINVSFTEVGAGYNDTTNTCSSVDCHGNNDVIWGSTTLGCSSCHFGAGADVDSFAWGDSKTAYVNSAEWSYSGHGKASGTYEYTGHTAANFGSECAYCHNSSVPHQDTNYFRLRKVGTNDLNSNCLACHATGSAGVTVDATTKNSTLKVDKYHGGAKHGDPRDAGRWCWDCHDPHGDASAASQRIQMIQRNPQKNPDAYGVPTSNIDALYNTVIFYNSAIGAGDGGFARASGTLEEGICNVCHTQVSQYTQTTGASSHPTSQCTICHAHSGNTTYDGNAFKGSGCNGCHGNSTVGNYWPDGSAAAVMPTANSAGRHAKHMEILAARIYTEQYNTVLLTNTGNGTADDKQRALCAFCHTTPGADSDHGVLANLPADVHGMKNLWTPYAGDNASYSSDQHGATGDDTCTSVNCHNSKTTTTIAPESFGWYGANTSACIMCHSNAPTEQSHSAHLFGSVYGLAYNCGYCHDAATNWDERTLGSEVYAPPANNHINGNLNVNGSVTLTYSGGSCGANACHNNGRNGDPATTPYTWGTTTNGGCNFCHQGNSAGHSQHNAGFNVFYSDAGIMWCTSCHTHSGPSAQHMNANINVLGTMGYNGTNLGVTQAAIPGTCTTKVCHQDGRGTAQVTPIWNRSASSADNCTLCHFNAAPAATYSHDAHIGSVGATQYNTAALNNSTAGEYRFSCAKCHGNTLANHLNTTAANWASAPNVNVAATVTYNTVTDSCVNNACHNNGQGAGAGNDALRTAYWTAMNWGAGDDSDDCNNCHGNSPTSNAHRAHAVGIHANDIYSGTTGTLTTATAAKSHGDAATSTTISCNVCHSGTVTMARNKLGSECVSCHTGDANDATNLMAVADKKKHVDDGTVKAEVSFIDMTAFKSKAQLRDNLADATENGSLLSAIWNRVTGYKAAADYDKPQVAYNTATFAAGNCSNVACHNSNLAVWNSAGNINPATYAPNCMGCHTSLPK